MLFLDVSLWQQRFSNLLFHRKYQCWHCPFLIWHLIYHVYRIPSCLLYTTSTICNFYLFLMRKLCQHTGPVSFQQVNLIWANINFREVIMECPIGPLNPTRNSFSKYLEHDAKENNQLGQNIHIHLMCLYNTWSVLTTLSKPFHSLLSLNFYRFLCICYTSSALYVCRMLIRLVLS